MNFEPSSTKLAFELGESRSDDAPVGLRAGTVSFELTFKADASLDDEQSRCGEVGHSA